MSAPAAVENISWSDFVPVGRELEYLEDAFRSGWVSGGAYVEKLEAVLRDLFPGTQAYAVANGTLALQLAFQALGVKPGDEVVVPAFCFQAAANVLVQLGATPVFCDVDPLTWNQTAEAVERAWTTRTVGVVVVHNYGATAPAGAIAEIAAKRQAWMIEDCAEAWFSRHRGKYVGQFGALATFSMHATKPIACGEGGIVLSSDPELDERIRLLRSHGLDRTRAHYFHLLAGNNYRLSNLLAAVAYGQLESRDHILAEQSLRLRWYVEELGNHWAFQFQHSLRDSADSIWAVAVRIPYGLLSLTRDELIAQLRSDGIETRPGFYPASALGYHGAPQEACPVADAVASEVIALPCSAKLTRDGVRRICTRLRELVDGSATPGAAHRVEVLRRDPAAVPRVAEFHRSVREGRKSFRYFDKRPFEAVLRQDVTLLVSAAGRDIGYGHLETESGVTWLGIAVADDHRGRGWARIIMHRLLAEAADSGVPEISLRVDADNLRGIRLYERFGFVRVQSASPGDSILMRKSVAASSSPRRT